MPMPAIRNHGNPNWGRRAPRSPVLLTEFEIQARRLHLAPLDYASSKELRIWCLQNKNHFYIPEWLLDAWQISVDTDLTGAA